MNTDFAMTSERSPETFAAELTEAVFPVALRFGGGDLWIDLELDLWNRLSETVKKWHCDSPTDDSSCEFDLERKGMLTELADTAYRTALRHGTRRSLPHSGADLHQAFRSAIKKTVRSFERVSA
jgi:hypothetical protein